MENQAFESMKKSFRQADTETKIAMYIEADGLTQPQYRELLHMFPMSDLKKLEAALG